MKLRPLKIGQIIITPRMTLSLICAFIVLGMGIGATVASPSNSKFALFICSIISLIIFNYTFLKKKKTE